MKVTPTELNPVYIIEPTVYTDNRGFFMETYNEAAFSSAGLPSRFVQDNHSLSRAAGTLRGLHFQVTPKAQGKLVRCLKGSILDVAVDIRPHSPTFKKWLSILISAENKKQLWVPPGFAHGFLTLEPDTEVAYKVTEFYSREHDRSIIWNDSDLAINWNTDDPILSEKDREAKSLSQTNLIYDSSSQTRNR